MQATLRRLGAGSLVGACLLATSASTLAETFTYQLRDYSYPRAMGQLDGGNSQLDLGAYPGSGLLGLTDTAKLSASAQYPGDVAAPKDSDGFYNSVTAGSLVTGATLDVATHTLTGFTTSGGFTLTAPVIKSVSSGGSLTISDLSVDLQARTIKGNIVGGNGVGSQGNVTLWQIGEIDARSAVVGHNTCPNLPYGGCDYFGAEGFDRIDISVKLPELSLTLDGATAVRKSLGLFLLGTSALNAALMDETTSLNLVAHFEVPPGFNLTAVPEPGTFALMGLGLGLIGLFGPRTQRSKG